MKKINKIYLGIILGVIAGVINVLLMISQEVSWRINISTFLTWVIVGFLISSTNLKLQGILKGIIISILVFIPSIVLVLEFNLTSAILIIVKALIFGSLFGYLIDRLGK
jgi:hypothetical protein